MKRTATIVVLSLLVLTTQPAWSAEGPQARRTSYVVFSRSGFPVRVAALEWIPPQAKTVLLAAHGLGAVKENTWGPLVVPGYSLGVNQYGRGRATVAIDFPGQGESEGNPYLVGVEDHAYVVQQIAFMLRRRFEHVVGIGHSLGALVVSLAQATFEALPQPNPLFLGGFDAIISGAFSHAGSEAGCTGPTIKDTLFTSYADQRVVNDFLWRLRPPKETFAFTGPPLYSGGPASAGPAPDELTRNVTVPVLLVLGGSDCVLDTSRYTEEPSYYGSSDVKVVVLSRTGHAVFHHLNHRHVDAIVASWLTTRKL